MANEQDGEPQVSQADFAQAFKDLARGEQAATALENHLDSLEKKIEEILKKAEEEEKKMNGQTKSKDDLASSSKGDNSSA